MKRALLSMLFILSAVLSGCKKNETATVGHSLLITADPYVPLMQQEVEQFISLYPQVKMEVRGASTREAIVLLLNDSVHTIVVDRQFNEEEKQVAQQASIRLIENKIAEDGVAIIVNKQNPIPNITDGIGTSHRHKNSNRMEADCRISLVWTYRFCFNRKKLWYV